MTIENAHTFLDELKKKGPDLELIPNIWTEFFGNHVDQALKERRTSKDELLKATA